MSTPARPQQTTSPAPKPIVPTGAPKAPVRKTETKIVPTFLFDKENYLMMAGGIALIFIGFLLMSGGKSANPHEFHYEEIYSFRRITLAPIVVLLGFIVEVLAIMKKPKENANEVA